MGTYRDCILPRIVDRVADTGPIRKLRSEVCAGLSGEVLEVGFGSGLNVPFYPDAVERVTAVDPATLGRRLAAERLAGTPVPVEFVDLRPDGGLPLDDDSVDEVLVTLTLCTIPDVEGALGEMHRVLRPDGTMRFFEHGLAESASARRWQRRIEPLWKPLGGGCHLTRRIDVIVEQAGFEATIERRRSPGPEIFNSMYVGTARPA